MTRQTSIEAFNKIKKKGLLKRLRWDVYKVLFDHGPLTSNELAVRYFSPLQYQSLSSRFSELRDMGVIQEIGKKKDDYTKMKVILWDVTNKLPIKINKKISKKDEEIDLFIEREREECALMAESWGCKLLAAQIRARSIV